MAERDRGSGPGFFTGLFMGGAAGLAIGLLLAPKSGSETRTMLTERSKEWRDKAEELSAATRDRLGSAMSEGRRAASEVRSELDLEELDLDDESL